MSSRTIRDGFEFETEVDEGVTLRPTCRPWRGIRVRYRRQGARRFESFLLSTDDEKIPSLDMILQAVQQHAQTLAGNPSPTIDKGGG